jgi:hypothetical protein
MTGISFQYPAWFSIFCVLLGLAYALGLYYKNRTFLEQSSRLNWALGALRFLAVTLLSLLLLSPVLKSLVTETKKPIVVVAQDNSQSIGAGMTAENLERFKQDLNSLKSSLSNDYEVKNYTFGENVVENDNFTFGEKISNLSDMIKNIYDIYSNQNLGAIILATDGIYNEGSSPLYAATKIGAPIYTIALGDTTRKKDLSVKRIFANKIAYLGDKFTLQADIAAMNCAGAASQISVYKEEGSEWRKVQNNTVSITKNDFFQTLTFTLDADKPGVQHFRLVASEIAGEATKENNAKDVFIDVLDARQRILILANAPHPDVSALRQSIETNKNYKVEVANIGQNNAKISDFDFVILHQLPSRTNDAAAVLRSLNEKKIPRLFIIGQQTNFSLFNAAQGQIVVNGGSNENTNDVTGKVNPNFSTFTFSENIGKNIPNFAPIVSPFAADYKENATTQTFLYQRIGKVDTKFPLVTVGEDNGDIKVGVITAEGLWKWRLFDYLQHQNHLIFDEIIGKTVQFLSVKEDKRKFRVATAKTLYNENEQIVFDAELYNDNFELINEPDANLTLKNDKGEELLFTFNKTGKTYSLNAKQLPSGNYNFKGKTNYNGQEYTYDGRFSIQPLQLEIYETTANHALLNTLSQQHNGKMYYATQLAALGDEVKNNKNVKSIIYQTSKTRSVINLKWIFFLILSLLSLEWFARRYFGSY